MVRSMYSGVAGMKAQQAAMDVIGNNIANVRTYGFKSSRATFKDVYYQRLNGGSQGTANRGGTNTSQVGYGSQLSTVDVMQTQSSFTMTGRSMDIAIAGEGFFQVQDNDGNIFYTRAGQLSFDSVGNLVDASGNFILGVSGDPLGREPASERISVNVSPVDPTASKCVEMINGKRFTIKTTNPTEEGNYNLSIISDRSMPLGQDVDVELVAGGGIVARINPSAKFKSLAELSSKINEKIKEKNGGKEHPAGQIEISCDTEVGELTGEEICGKNFAVKPGKVKGDLPSGLFGGLSIDKLGDDFKVNVGQTEAKIDKIECKYDEVTKEFTITMTTDQAGTFEGKIPETATGAGKVLLQGANGSIVINHPGFTSMINRYEKEHGNLNTGTWDNNKAADDFNAAPDTKPITFTSSEPSKDIGLSSKAFKLQGGTKGGAQGIEDLDSILVGADGIIVAKHPIHGEIAVGRIDLVTFANPEGLEQAGNTYFKAGANCGKQNIAIPGSNGTGQLTTGSLEQSNVDLSQEFSDMITTQRAYQANSRLITVSDTMLEELVNLKR